MTDQGERQNNFGRNDRELEADDRRRRAYDGGRQPRDQDSFQQRPQYGRGGGGYRGGRGGQDYQQGGFNNPPDFRNNDGPQQQQQQPREDGESGRPAFRSYPPQQYHNNEGGFEEGEGFGGRGRGGRGRGGRGRGGRGRGGYDNPQFDDNAAAAPAQNDEGQQGGGNDRFGGDYPQRRGGYGGRGGGRGGRGGSYHNQQQQDDGAFRMPHDAEAPPARHADPTAAAEGGAGGYDRPPRDFNGGEGRPQYRSGPKRYDQEIKPLRYEQREQQPQRQYERRDNHQQQAAAPAEPNAHGVIRVTRAPRFRRNNYDEEEVEQLFAMRHNQKGISFDNYESIAVEIVPDSEPAASFASLKVEKALAENLARCGYERPTPVQKYGIPVCLEGRDLMACAQTGSGKTAAFLIPVVNHILIYGVSPMKNRCSHPIALVMAPTRELALQIYDEARKLCFKTDIYCDVVYGGKPYPQHFEQDLLVACPGRLKDIFDQERVSFSKIKFLILDEADRMLEMGFEEQIEYLVASRYTDMPPPDERQTLMFSATFPKRIRNLAQAYLRQKYSLLTVGRVGSTTKNITQVMLHVPEEKKQSRLLELLYQQNQTDLVLVFVETRRAAEELFTLLYDEGIPTSTIHGDRKQYEREEALKRFKEGKTPILVATDVASRGLDIPDVSHIIQYDLPHSMDDYTHRIGRTGRAGNKGTATSFFNDRNMLLLQELCAYLSEHEQHVPQWMEDMKDVQDMKAFHSTSTRGGAGRGGNRRGGGGGGGGGGGRGGGGGGGYRDERSQQAPLAAAPKPKRSVVPKCDVADGGF